MAGMYHALVEARMPFDLVHEAFLRLEYGNEQGGIYAVLKGI